jgi:hypothetical protein
MTHFGEHVTLDGYNGEFSLLNSEEVVTKALKEMPAAMAGGFNNTVRDLITIPTTSGHDVYAFGQFTQTSTY